MTAVRKPIVARTGAATSRCVARPSGIISTQTASEAARKVRTRRRTSPTRASTSDPSNAPPPIAAVRMPSPSGPVPSESRANDGSNWT